MRDDPTNLLERISLVAPLGLRFQDTTTGAFVSDGLSVMVYPSGNPRQRTSACANRSGIYVAHHLPGLHSIGSGIAWESLPIQRSFVVEIVDLLRRFQPCMFTALLPARGLFIPYCVPLDSLPDSVPITVPLFSAPTRNVPAGMAVVRADLWDDGANQPAAWAMLEIAGAGLLPVRGIADEKGRIALIFPYPEPVEFAIESLATVPGSLASQQWSLTLRAFYWTDAQVARIPDLCDLLGQEPAQFSSQAPADTLTVILEYGKECIVKTPFLSTLLLQQAGSPPV